MGVGTVFKCTWGRYRVTSQSASSRKKTSATLGPPTTLPRRHRAFRHRDIGFSDWAVNFVRARGSLKSVREQKPLQGDAVGPDALQREMYSICNSKRFRCVSRTRG